VDLGPGELLDLYYYMVLSRTFEERVSTLYKQGRVQAGVFSGIGQEAICVGTAYGLDDEDFVAPAHRDLGVFLVKGVSPRAIMAQLYGRADGLSRGKDSALHAGEPEINVFGTTSMLGAQLCVTAGAALAFKMLQEPRVAVSYFGEGASARGDFHEALNFAGVHRLPMILLIENNGYAISVPAERETAVRDIAMRAAGYAMPGVIVDGADVIGCFLAARDAVARALAGEGPTLIEAKVTRLTGHSSDDQQTKYRSEEELAEQRTQDPLPGFRAELRAAGLLSEAAEAALAAEVAAVVDDATAFAEAAPDPDPATLLRHVYAEPGDPVPGPPPGAVPAPPPSPIGGLAFNSTPGAASPVGGSSANVELKVPAPGDGSATPNAAIQPPATPSSRGVASNASAPGGTGPDGATAASGDPVLGPQPDVPGGPA